MNRGLLEFYRGQGTAYEVAMNEVKFLYFGQSGLTSIGTANLNGCSGVIIASTYGAIVAHISPRPDYHSSNLHAGDRHVEAKMQEVAALYNANKKYFPTTGNNWVICAVFRGKIALPDQQSIMQACLTRLGLGHSLATYTAGSQKDSFPGQGTIFVNGSGTGPVVYVEDKIVSQGSQGSSTTPYATSSSAGSSSYNSSYTSTPYTSTPLTSYATTPYTSTPLTSYATQSYAGPSQSAGYASAQSDQPAPVVGEWSEWKWREDYNCYVRERENSNVKGGSEWDYKQPQAGPSNEENSSNKGKSSAEGKKHHYKRRHH